MWDAALERWREIASAVETWSQDTFSAGGWVDLGMVGRIPLSAILFILAGGSLLLLWWTRRRRRSSGVDGTDLAAITRRPRILGYLAALLLLGGFGGWSLAAPLASAAIAPGVVSPDGKRKTIQHQEGGIIREIHVREGDSVVAGQPLVTLEDIQARADYEEMRERYAYLLATEARLVAEQTGTGAIEFPNELTGLSGDGARRAMTSQEDLLRSHRATQEAREQILGQREKQLDEEIAGLHEVIAAEDTQLGLIDQEIAGVRKLYDKGLERLPRLLALQRAQADIHAEQAGNRANIARNKQEIGETEMQVLTMRQQDQERANEELTKVRTDVAELRSQLPSREDVLSRKVIQAPISGTVMDLKITTESGVLGPGHPILDIVPAEAKLIIDAQVKPVDIDTVRPGMTARVLLTAYRQRTLPQIHGVLRSISADRLVEDRSGNAYFLAKVEVDPAELARLGDVRLVPGMPAEVMILTGEQTLLDIVLGPLLESVTKSFRES